MSEHLKPVDFTLEGWERTVKESNSTEAGDNAVDKQYIGIPLDKLTELSVDGKGVFDVLMRAGKLHLDEEYSAGRIVGAEYAQVYISMVASSMQAANQFLMNEQQSLLLGAQISLARQQTVTELTKTCDNIPPGLGFNFIPNANVPMPPAYPYT